MDYEYYLQPMSHILRNEHHMQTNTSHEHDFLITTGYNEIQKYQGKEVLIHWHTEYEVIYVLHGKMLYFDGLREMVLNQGEGILINQKHLHGFRRYHHEDCGYLVLNFHPHMLELWKEGRVYQKYVEHFLLHRDIFDVISLNEDVIWQKDVLNLTKTLFQEQQRAANNYELHMQIELLKMWMLLYENDLSHREDKGKKSDKEKILYRAISYIQEHVSEKIYISEIARYCNVSETECWRIFNRQIGQSPGEYIQKLRILKSLEYLKDTSMSLTEVAQKTGFDSHSYYSKVFKKIMNCTPRDYRKNMR